MRMASQIQTARFPKDRSGTTVVETALVLPVFLFIVFAIIEFGHAQMVINVLQNACRNGARIGTTDGISTANVVARVNQTCSSAFARASVSTFVLDAGVIDSGGFVPTTGYEIEALPPIELLDAEPRQIFLVRATVPYNDIALIPMSFMKDIVLNGQSFMRHE